MKHFSISDCIARCDNGVGASPRIEWTTEEETGHKHKQTGSYYETDSGTSRLWKNPNLNQKKLGLPCRYYTECDFWRKSPNSMSLFWNLGSCPGQEGGTFRSIRFFNSFVLSWWDGLPLNWITQLSNYWAFWSPSLSSQLSNNSVNKRLFMRSGRGGGGGHLFTTRPHLLQYCIFTIILATIQLVKPLSHWKNS